MNLILLGAALSRPPELDTLPPLAAAGIVIARMVGDIRRDIRRDTRPCYVPRYGPGVRTSDLGEYLGDSPADSDAGVRSRGDLYAAPPSGHTVRANLLNFY